MDSLQLVKDAIDFIENHLTEEISVTDVAAQSGLSIWHFQRIFHGLVGETIGVYVRSRRLSCAVEELRTTDRKVIDIALDYQFGSPEAFSRAFRAEYGRSPLQFRQQGVKIVPRKKPVLDAKRLDHLVADIKLEPEIKIIDSISVVGVLASFVSPLSKRAAYMTDIPLVWKEFVQKEASIPNKVGAIKTGLIEGIATGLSHHIHDDLMDYLACTPVTTIGMVPEGMRAAVIPGGKYAVFHYKGYHDKTQYIVDYIYSTWLPKTGIETDQRPEFTWLDHRAQALDPVESLIQYHLPIK